MKLSGPVFFEWMGLRRGGLARWESHYYDHRNRLIPDIVDGLLKDGLLELGDPDEVAGSSAPPLVRMADPNLRGGGTRSEVGEGSQNIGRGHH